MFLFGFSFNRSPAEGGRRAMESLDTDRNAESSLFQSEATKGMWLVLFLCVDVL